MTPISTRKSILLARQAALLSRIGEISGALGTHQEKDWEDIAVEREGDEVLETLGIEAQAELRSIKAALARMSTGDPVRPVGRRRPARGPRGRPARERLAGPP